MPAYVCPGCGETFPRWNQCLSHIRLMGHVDGADEPFMNGLRQRCSFRSDVPGSVKGTAGSTDMRKVPECSGSGKGCGKRISKGRCGPRNQGAECSSVEALSKFTTAINDGELELHGGTSAKGKGKTESKGHGRKKRVQQEEEVVRKGKGNGKGLGKEIGEAAVRKGKGKGSGKGLGKEIGALNAVGKGRGRLKGVGDYAQSRSKRTNDGELEVHGGITAKGKGETKSKGHGRKKSVQQQEAAVRKGKGTGKGNGKGLGEEIGALNAVGKGRGRSTGVGGYVRRRSNREIASRSVVEPTLAVSLEALRPDYHFTQYDWESTLQIFELYGNVKAVVVDEVGAGATFTFEDLVDAQAARTALNGMVSTTDNWECVDFVIHIEWLNPCQKPPPLPYASSPLPGVDMQTFPGSSLGQDSSSPTCAICQEDLNGACETLDCMHTFHRACAVRCVPHIRRSGCPMCRFQSPVWLQGLAHADGLTSEATSDSDSEFEPYVASDGLTSEPELDSDSESEPVVDTYDHSNGMEQRAPSVVSDDDYFWSQLHEEIEVLRDEFPDLDSDALDDVYHARIQDDCDEFGGYCSGGS